MKSDQTRAKVQVCSVCGKISTPIGAKTSSQDCQLTRRVPCTFTELEMLPREVNAYCEKRGWRPLYPE